MPVTIREGFSVMLSEQAVAVLASIIFKQAAYPECTTTFCWWHREVAGVVNRLTGAQDLFFLCSTVRKKQIIRNQFYFNPSSVETRTKID